MGGRKGTQAHFCCQVIGRGVTDQGFVHVVGQKRPVLAGAKSENIRLFIQFQLIGKLAEARVPGTVSASADRERPVIQGSGFRVIGIISLDMHGGVFILCFAGDAVAVRCVDINHRELAAVNPFHKLGVLRTCKGSRDRQKVVQVAGCRCVGSRVGYCAVSHLPLVGEGCPVRHICHRGCDGCPYLSVFLV